MQPFNMKSVSNKGLDLIKSFEGLRLTAYLCSANVPTIGYGATYYANDSKVKLGDKITKEQADVLLRKTVRDFEQNVNALLNATAVNQNQFDALVSFAFNLGTAALAKSTLLKKVKENPGDPAISREFAKWVNAGGLKQNGLVTRRRIEAELYFRAIV
jgi:lysozyme